jgi:hypothetical protein
MAQHAQLWRGFHLVGLCIGRPSRG